MKTWYLGGGRTWNPSVGNNSTVHLFHMGCVNNVIVHETFEAWR